MLKKMGGWLWWPSKKSAEDGSTSTTTGGGDLDMNDSFSSDTGSFMMSPTMKPKTFGGEGGGAVGYQPCDVHWLFSLRADYQVQSLPFPADEIDVIEEEIVRRFALEFSDILECRPVVNQQGKSNKVKSANVTPMRASPPGKRTTPGGSSAAPPLSMQEVLGKEGKTPPRGMLGTGSSGGTGSSLLSGGGGGGDVRGGGTSVLLGDGPSQHEDVMTLTLPVNVLLVQYLGDFIGMADMVQDFISGFSDKPSSVVVFVFDKHPEPVDQLAREQNEKLAGAVNAELCARNPQAYQAGSILSLASLQGSSCGGVGNSSGSGTFTLGQPPLLVGQQPVGGTTSSPTLVPQRAGGEEEYSDQEDGITGSGQRKSDLNCAFIDTDFAYQHALTMLTTESFNCVRCHSVALLIYEELRKLHLDIKATLKANGGSVERGLHFGGGGGGGNTTTTTIPPASSSGGAIHHSQLVAPSGSPEKPPSSAVGITSSGDIELKEQPSSPPGEDQCVSSEYILDLSNTSLKTVEIIVRNLLTAGEEERYLVLNHVSERFHKIIGSHSSAMMVLGNVGFADAEYTAQSGAVEPRLALPVGLLPYCVPEIKRTLNCLRQELKFREQKKADAKATGKK